MITFRPLVWPADRAAVIDLDTSFTSDRVYRLASTDRSRLNRRQRFRLVKIFGRFRLGERGSG
jgi:hypothetical protein